MKHAFSTQMGLLLTLILFLVSCSSSPEFTPGGQQEKLRGDIQVMRAQWRSEKCPSNAKKSQCDELLQSGLRHCMNRNPSNKTKCIYTELYCTLFGGKACRF